MQQSIQLISVGRHTRLGDILECALEGVSFQSVRAEDFVEENREQQKLLFAVSGDALGKNEALSALTRDVLSGKCNLDGSVCAVVGDGEQGGALHANILQLLLALNSAGCAIIRHPCVEASRDLKNLPYQTGDEGTLPFELYCKQGRLLVERLLAFQSAETGDKQIRFVCALESEGIDRDWQDAITRVAGTHGCKLVQDDKPAEKVLLLCENASNAVDEATARRIDKLKACALSCIVASPRFGSDFYCMQLLEQACVQGVCELAPRAFTVFDGASASQVLAVGTMFEKARYVIATLCK